MGRRRRAKPTLERAAKEVWRLVGCPECGRSAGEKCRNVPTWTGKRWSHVNNANAVHKLRQHAYNTRDAVTRLAEITLDDG